MPDFSLTPTPIFIGAGALLLLFFILSKGMKVFSKNKTCPKCHHEAPKRIKRPLLIKYLFLPLKYYCCNSCQHKYFVFGR